MDDGQKKGFVSDAYAISFSVSTEFNAAGLYFYFTENPEIIQAIDMSILADSDQIIPIFTISNLFSEQLPQGWNLYTAPMYKVESDLLPDTMPIDSLFNESLINTINYHKKYGLSYDTFIKFSVMKDNVMLDPTTDFTVDLNKMTLTTNIVNMVSTYRLIVYVNTLYINNLIADIININEEK
jgi:hypothetical protein